MALLSVRRRAGRTVEELADRGLAYAEGPAPIRSLAVVDDAHVWRRTSSAQDPATIRWDRRWRSPGGRLPERSPCESWPTARRSTPCRSRAHDRCSLSLCRAPSPMRGATGVTPLICRTGSESPGTFTCTAMTRRVWMMIWALNPSEVIVELSVAAGIQAAMAPTFTPVGASAGTLTVKGTLDGIPGLEDYLRLVQGDPSADLLHRVLRQSVSDPAVLSRGPIDRGEGDCNRLLGEIAQNGRLHQLLAWSAGHDEVAGGLRRGGGRLEAERCGRIGPERRAGEKQHEGSGQENKQDQEPHSALLDGALRPSHHLLNAFRREFTVT